MVTGPASGDGMQPVAILMLALGGLSVAATGVVLAWHAERRRAQSERVQYVAGVLIIAGLTLFGVALGLTLPQPIFGL